MGIYKDTISRLRQDLGDYKDKKILASQLYPKIYLAAKEIVAIDENEFRTVLDGLGGKIETILQDENVKGIDFKILSVILEIETLLNEWDY